MRHRNKTVKLGRTSSHREAMFRNMVTSLLKNDRIRTTDAKAKALRKWADHIITLAKRGDLHARRQALAIVREKNVVHKIFEEADDRFGTINGGYTRIIKLGIRPGDCASMSMVELVEVEAPKKKKKKKKKKADPVVTAPVEEAVEEAAEEAVEAAPTEEETPEAEEAPAEDTEPKKDDTPD